jgi:hypothetical protein
MLGFHPLASQPLSSLPTATSLFSESPVLTAVGLGDGTVSLSWTLNPDVAVHGFLLRRSAIQPPVSADQGQFVFQGPGFNFIDVDVEVGTHYFYSIFAITSQAPLIYVPYEPQASDDVVPALVRLGTRVVREYVPYSGEFGVVSAPWPYGRLTAVWNVNGPDHDTWKLPRGRKIFAPVSGTVTSVSPLALDTDSGIRVTLAGPFVTALVRGDTVVSGAPIADSRGGDVTIKAVKLAVAEFGDRVIRPSYLYLAVDRRR